MRSKALCVCALALIACTSNGPDGTVQASATLAGGKDPSAGPSSEHEGGGGGSAASGDASLNGGCTYTQGYWKNHPSAWPVTSLTIGGVSYSEQQLLDLFNTAPKGDASIILGHQLSAALLNTANGAGTSAAVEQAISDAQAWMAANQGSNAGLPFGVSAGSAAGQQATALTQTLDNFNSGLSGTLHCGSGSSSSGGSSSGGGSSSSGGSGSSSGSGSSCGDGVTPCTSNGQCLEGAQCIGGCCVAPPPPEPPPTAPPPSTPPAPR